MLQIQVAVVAWWSRARLALRERAADDRGMTTETVIITAALAALAIVVTGIIVAKVTGKAESIDVGA